AGTRSAPKRSRGSRRRCAATSARCSASRRSERMQKRIVIVLLVALVGTGAAAWYLLSDRRDHGPLTLYGNVDIREVDLGFRVPGRLAAMHREEGDRVKAGELLAELDDAPYRHALDAA